MISSFAVCLLLNILELEQSRRTTSIKTRLHQTNKELVIKSNQLILKCARKCSLYNAYKYSTTHIAAAMLTGQRNKVCNRKKLKVSRTGHIFKKMTSMWCTVMFVVESHLFACKFSKYVEKQNSNVNDRGSAVSGKHLSHFAHTSVFVRMCLSMCACMRTVFIAYSDERMLVVLQPEISHKEEEAETQQQIHTSNRRMHWYEKARYYYDRFKLKGTTTISTDHFHLLITNFICLFEKSQSALSWI